LRSRARCRRWRQHNSPRRHSSRIPARTFYPLSESLRCHRQREQAKCSYRVATAAIETVFHGAGPILSASFTLTNHP